MEELYCKISWKYLALHDIALGLLYWVCSGCCVMTCGFLRMKFSNALLVRLSFLMEHLWDGALLTRTGVYQMNSNVWSGMRHLIILQQLEDLS